jgi:hypothetical protein
LKLGRLRTKQDDGHAKVTNFWEDSTSRFQLQASGGFKAKWPHRLPKNQRKRSMEQFKRYENKCQAIEFRLTSNSYSSEIKQAMKLNDTNTQQLMTQQEQEPPNL